MIGGRPWTPLCPSPSPTQIMAWRAREAMRALAWGYRIRVESDGPLKDRKVMVGALHGISNEHPTRREHGSTLILTFQDGRTIPLERVARLDRAPD